MTEDLKSAKIFFCLVWGTIRSPAPQYWTKRKKKCHLYLMHFFRYVYFYAKFCNFSSLKQLIIIRAPPPHTHIHFIKQNSVCLSEILLTKRGFSSVRFLSLNKRSIGENKYGKELGMCLDRIAIIVYNFKYKYIYVFLRRRIFKILSLKKW